MTAPLTQLSPAQHRVLISLNPRAGARGGQPLSDALQQQLEAKGWAPHVTTDLDEVKALTEEWFASGALRCVVAAGGDGTVGMLTNLLPEGVPIAVLPLGTENLLSKHLGIEPSAADVGETIDLGRVARLDAGEANGRLFLLMLGCGFDAEVVRRLHSSRQGHIHHLSYAVPILDSIRKYQYPDLRISIGDDEVTRTAKWAFIVNFPKYAGGLNFSPSATAADGLLDICTFRQGSLWHGLRYLTGVVLGQHESWDDFCHDMGTRVRIESDAEVPYQLDGDPGGNLPVDVRVLPGRLSILVPKGWSPRPDQDSHRSVVENGGAADNLASDGSGFREGTD